MGDTTGQLFHFISFIARPASCKKKPESRGEAQGCEGCKPLRPQLTVLP